MAELVGYESLSERDGPMLANFEPAVTAIASRPFSITGRGDDAATWLA